ncbi:MAG: PilZ domain-containing protein [Proteobacteria bacterium]|nr:PilZ domain-containing protein [Pseudomonadota bacterium]
MNEKRWTKRLVQKNEIILTVVYKGKKSPNKRFIHHISTDISTSGARIQANTFLPVDSLLKIQLTLKGPLPLITALGKVKWIRRLYTDESYEAGLEFTDISRDTTTQLGEYISRTQKKASPDVRVGW